MTNSFISDSSNAAQTFAFQTLRIFSLNSFKPAVKLMLHFTAILIFATRWQLVNKSLHPRMITRNSSLPNVARPGRHSGSFCWNALCNPISLNTRRWLCGNGNSRLLPDEDGALRKSLGSSTSQVQVYNNERPWRRTILNKATLISEYQYDHFTSRQLYVIKCMLQIIV